MRRNTLSTPGVDHARCGLRDTPLSLYLYLLNIYSSFLEIFNELNSWIYRVSLHLKRHLLLLLYPLGGEVRPRPKTIHFSLIVDGQSGINFRPDTLTEQTVQIERVHHCI